MSTPVTFSGFNDIDFNLVVNSLMAQASLPLNNLQTQQKALESQVSGFDKLTGLVSTLRSAADALGKPASLAMLAGRSSNESAVTVSAAANAAAGSYDIIVNELARAQVTVSSSSAPDANTTVVASAGTVTIGGVAVTISGDVTLQALAAAINATPGIGVSAGVIRTGTTTYKLALTGLDPGAAHAFTITNALTGGTGVTFTDTDQNGISGDTAADNAVSASDASLLVNNIPVTGESNVFADLMPGVTITALKKDPAATITVDVATDTTSLKTHIQAFVTAYNELVKFQNEQRTSAATGDASSIGRNPILRSLQMDLRNGILGAYGTGVLTRLPEAGVEFTRTGELKLNESIFDAAVAVDPDHIRELFGGTTGAFIAIEATLDTYEAANGFIRTGKDRLSKQIDAMTAQIEAMQQRLAVERETLKRQFAEADLAMSRLKSQAGSLSNFASIFSSE